MSLELYKEKSKCINCRNRGIRSLTKSLVFSFQVGLEANVDSDITICPLYGFPPFHQRLEETEQK